MSSLRIRHLAVTAIVGLSHCPTNVFGAATCYRLNGNVLDDSFVPCNPDAEVSACCGSNKDNGDICLSSGLCYAQVDGFTGLMYQNGCTDKTGKSKDCPHICPDVTNNWDGGDPVESYNVLQCNATAICCRGVGDSKNCCDDPETVINDFNPGSLVLASITASGSPTQTAASSSSPPSGDSSADSCPKNNAGVVGGAVGGVLGAALLGALGTIALLMKKNKNGHAKPAAAEEVTALQWQQHPQKYSSPSPYQSPSSQYHSSQAYTLTPPPPQTHELEEHVQRHEI